MEIIEFKSEISKGTFLVRFTFEDDTDVFLDENGYDCQNFNNVRPDGFYIDKAIAYYLNQNKRNIY